MRPAFRLLQATVRSGGRYLEPGTPTGLTGLYTHASPRSTLLYLYSSTLDKLKAGVPEHSLYRQSVEALTKHRMSLVESVIPPGYEAWAEKARKLLKEHPERFNVVSSASVDGAAASRVERGGQVFLIRHLPKEEDMRYQEWDGEIDEGPELEGSRSLDEKRDLELLAQRSDMHDSDKVEWESEPQLTAEQVYELEHKIGAGLIEEVVQVAEGELKLVDTMIQAKAWEDLEEKPAEGQWVYFERKA
ncbi:ETC complex I subunit conserved region-domain-containing protein [Diplogelasinospora grovesii]|uniref:ETC complex I subunit conserved region-domain-containing protein n=1 Tax=Diplogelasinospora grovesii TaxID=303347 RepID=A0AAN6N7P9_9PEZI|nr:ETC complex I subunit conserved region-domain-containing protein [Diplogelasinospora grovesii]